MQVAIAITGLDLTIAIAIHVQDVGLYTIGLYAYAWSKVPGFQYHSQLLYIMYIVATLVTG